MTSLNYNIIFSYFLGKVKDFDFVKLDEPEVLEILVEKLHSASATPNIRRMFSSLSFDDEEREMSYEMRYETDDDQDNEFVIALLSEQMVVEWLKPQLYSKVNTSQMYSTKEIKYYSQANHIEQMRGLYEDTVVNVRRMIRDRGYIHNSYLNG